MKKIILVLLILFVLVNCYTAVSINISGSNLHELSNTINFDYPNIPYNDHINYQLQSIDANTVHQSNTTLEIDDEIINFINQIDVSLVLGYIEDLVSIGPRRTTTEGCEQAGRYIFQQFESMGLEVKYKNWSSSSSLYGSNIEATLPGVDTQSDEIYIVCGHYDTVQPSPGADDNGAGTAAVLACAAIMSQYSFNHTIRFVTFSGEEQGLYGSRYYATESYELNEPIIAVLNADMMGYASDEESESKVIVYDNEPSSWITDLTTDIGQTYHDYINLEVVPGGHSGRSDHASFHMAYYDAIFYFEYEFNPFYHSSNDIIENMNPSYATNVTKLIIGTLGELADFVPQQAPNKPMQPTGKINGKINQQYTYKSLVTDPNNDDIYVVWDFGDEETSDWLGPYHSNEYISISHQWNSEGSYEIKLKAKDIYGQESEWSDPILVNMPKEKRYSQPLMKMIQRFPFLNRFIDVWSMYIAK